MEEALFKTQAGSSDADTIKSQTPKTVLIVDESEETRDVLATALERKGVRTFTASVPRRGAVIAREQKPDLVIFDVDAVSTSPKQAIDAFARAGNLEDAPIVAIGSTKFNAPMGEGGFISKPYHFAPLLQKIEQFLKNAGEVVLHEEEEIDVIF